MVVSATLGAALVLLAVLSESFSGFLWQDEPAFYCSDCDLSFGRHELSPGRPRRCPHGHALRRHGRFSWTVALSTACVTVIAVGLLHMSTGLGS